MNVSRKVTTIVWIAAGIIAGVAAWQLATNLTRPDPVAVGLTDISDPSWNPDGTKLVFSAFGEGSNNRDLWVIGVSDTGEMIGSPKQLTTSALDESTPAWGPSGRIAYSTSSDPDGAIQTILENGTDPVQLTHGDQRGTLPAWSPDGREVAFICSTEGGAGLCTINDRFEEFRELAPNAWLGRPAWSDDGLIAYGDPRGVMTIDAAGGEPTLLSPQAAPTLGVSWSPDGTNLAANIGGDLWTIDRDSGERTPVETGDLQVIGAPTWSDARIAIVGRTDSELAISLIRNDFEPTTLISGSNSDAPQE